MSINRERIQTLLGEANKALGVLESYAKLDDETMLQSIEKMSTIKYQFVVLIEACIDICNHLAVHTLKTTPESYSHCFEVMQEGGVLENPFAKKLGELARFRNVLVHRYWGVDDHRVLQILQTELHIFHEYIRIIAQWLVKKENAK
ncbi:MAG: DUF86 domain-containing protein [bacterium]